MMVIWSSARMWGRHAAIPGRVMYIMTARYKRFSIEVIGWQMTFLPILYGGKNSWHFL